MRKSKQRVRKRQKNLSEFRRKKRQKDNQSKEGGEIPWKSEINISIEIRTVGHNNQPSSAPQHSCRYSLQLPIPFLLPFHHFLKNPRGSESPPTVNNNENRRRGGHQHQFQIMGIVLQDKNNYR